MGCIPDHIKAKNKKNIYLTDKAIRMKDLKNRLWKKYKQTRSSYDHTRYIKTKNSLRTLTRNLGFEFEKSIAADAKTAPKKFWLYVNSRTKTRNKIPSLQKKDGSIASTAAEKANALNSFFETTFTKENMTTVPEMDDNTFTGECLNTFRISPDIVLEKLPPRLEPSQDSRYRWMASVISETYRGSDFTSLIYSLPKIVRRGFVARRLVKSMCHSNTQERRKESAEQLPTS